MRVVGIFTTGSRLLDQSRSYVNTSTAQQFLKENRNFVTTIYANTIDPDVSERYVDQLKTFIDYEVEDWKSRGKQTCSCSGNQ